MNTDRCNPTSPSPPSPISNDESNQLISHFSFDPDCLREGQRGKHINPRPSITLETNPLKIQQPPEIAPCSDFQRDLRRLNYMLYETNDYSFLPMKFSSKLVNSMGNMNFVAGPVPISFSVSKYCRVIVFSSMPCAVS